MTSVASLYLYHFNCTENGYAECKIAYWLWRLVPFALLVIGVCGNILNIVVLSSQRMRKYSTTVYLTCMAGSDIVVLFSNLLPQTVLAITGIRLENLSRFWCRTSLWFLYTSGEFSVCLLVLLTIERLLLTKAPLTTGQKLTPKTSLIAALTLLGFLVAFNAHYIAGFMHYDSEDELKEELGDVPVQFPCTFTSKKYMEFYTGANGILLLILFNIIPSSIIVIGNVTIAADIIMRKKRLNKVNPATERSTAIESTPRNENATTQTTLPLETLSGNQLLLKIEEQPTSSQPQSSVNTINNENNPTNNTQSESTRAVAKVTKVKRSKSPNRILFTLSIFFVATTFPYGVYFVLLGNVGDISERDIAKWQLFTVVVLICGWSNFTFNFFLYFVSGTLFKQEWNRLLRTTKNRLHNLFH